jgi:archaellum biogenesis ATPase FlaH
VGLAGTGKTMYCRQFFIEGMLHSDYCIYVSPSMTEKKFRALFPMLEAARPNKTSKFINPYLRMDTNNINNNNNNNNSSSSTDDLDRLKLKLLSDKKEKMIKMIVILIDRKVMKVIIHPPFLICLRRRNHHRYPVRASQY